MFNNKYVLTFKIDLLFPSSLFFLYYSYGRRVLEISSWEGEDMWESSAYRKAKELEAETHQ